jgi:hypothetical protein
MKASRPSRLDQLLLLFAAGNFRHIGAISSRSFQVDGGQQLADGFGADLGSETIIYRIRPGLRTRLPSGADVP